MGHGNGPRRERRIPSIDLNFMKSFVSLCSLLAFFPLVSTLLSEDKTMVPSASVFLKNGDFGDWENGTPVGWAVASGVKLEKDESMTPASRQSLKMVIEADSKGKSGRIHQDLSLQPGCRYRLGGAMAKHGTGSVSVKIYPLVQGRTIGEPLLDWSNVWSWQYPWRNFSLDFETGAHREYRLIIANHGRTGEPFWLDGLFIEPKGLESVAGLHGQPYLFTQSVMAPFSATSFPDDARPLERILVNGTPGNHSPAFVGLHAFDGMEDVEVVLLNHLESDAGKVLPGSAVVVRSVADQALLPVSKPRSVEKGRNLGWWVTARVPEEAPPGFYEGRLQVRAKGGVLAEVPYTVRVEAFRLPKPPIPMFVYHAEAYFPPGDFLSRAMRLEYYQDMKEHGMNTVTVYNTPDVNGVDVDFEKDHRYEGLNPGRLEEVLKKTGLSRDDVAERKEFGLNGVMDILKESGLVTPGNPVIWLPVKSGQYSFGDMPSTALKKAVEGWMNHPDWPKPLLYVMDEPFGYPERIQNARNALTRIKALDLPVRTATANVGVEELGSLYNVWIQTCRRITPEMAEQAKQYGAEMWTYNCNMPTESGQFTRALYGFWAYRSGVKGVGLWAYYASRGWMMNAEGEVQGSNGVIPLSRVCASPEGPVPTISWETTREGVYDYGYALLFASRMKELEERAAQRWGEAKALLPVAVFEEVHASFDRVRTLEKLKWRPDDTSGEEGLARVREAVELEEWLRLARNVKDKVIDSVPFDAMAPMGDLGWSSENQGFLPVIGYGEPAFLSESKRNCLGAYIRLFSRVLESSSKGEVRR